MYFQAGCVNNIKTQVIDCENLHVRFLDSFRRSVEYFLVIKIVAIADTITAQATTTNTIAIRVPLLIPLP